LSSSSSFDMSNITTTNKKLPEPLPKETWNNKPRTSKPFSQETISKMEAWTSEMEILANSQSKFFTISPGQEVEVFFDMEHPDVGFIDKTFKDSKGQEITKRVFQFVVFNIKAQKEQTWAPSITWGMKAIQAMKDYGDTLIIRRKGAGLDTDYDFIAPGFKMAGK